MSLETGFSVEVPNLKPIDFPTGWERVRKCANSLEAFWLLITVVINGLLWNIAINHAGNDDLSIKAAIIICLVGALVFAATLWVVLSSADRRHYCAWLEEVRESDKLAVALASNLPDPHDGGLRRKWRRGELNWSTDLADLTATRSEGCSDE